MTTVFSTIETHEHTNRLMDQVKEAIAVSSINPHDKHVDVLLKASALCREITAVTSILCKSGKWQSYD